MENKKFIVTVTNQFCSTGRVIAKRLAELLDVECYNEYIVQEAARRLELPENVVEDTEERSRRIIISYDSIFSTRSHQLVGGGADRTQSEIFDIQQEIIKEAAEKGSCVVVGRCSDFILEEAENSLHIYIYAPYMVRVRHCMKVMDLTEQAACARVTAADEARRAYHVSFTGFMPDDPTHKDIMIDCSVLGTDGTARLLAEMVKEKFGLK